MSDPFSSPAKGARVTDYKGALLLISPYDYKENVATSFGEKDAVEANVVVLTEPTDGFPEGQGPAPHVAEGVLFFQGVLIGQTKAKVASKGMVLGRLGQRPVSKPGQNPAWALEDPTDEDAQKARDYLATLSDPFS